MKSQFRYSMIIVILILVSLMSVGLTQAQGYRDSNAPNPNNAHANLPWSSQYVQQQLDPPRDVGGYVSTAISSFNDFLVMSYYDATNHSLMAATPIAGHAGNCGTSNNWICVTLDSGGANGVGMYSSIDLWGNSLDNWKMGVSYYDMTNRALKAAIYTCYMGPCAWNIVTVKSPGSPQISTGLYSSFKFDSLGNAAIASFSYNSLNLSSTLIYAHQVPGGGNCGEGGAVGLWACKEFSFGSSEGNYASLDFSYDDVPYIAFYDVHEGDLGVIIITNSGMCGPEIGWECLDLDGWDGTDVGLYPSLIAPQYSGDLYRIAYYDKTNGHLKYYDPSWGPLVVDHMGTSISPMGIAMRIDSDGNPIIAYQQITSEFSPPTLNIARPYLEFSGEPYGNCGDNPPGNLFAYWFCSTLDNGGQYTYEADFA